MDGSCQLRKALAESILSPYTVLSVLPSLSYSWRSPLLCQLEASQLLLYFREHEVDCRCQIQWIGQVRVLLDHTVHIEEGLRQKRRQSSSLMVGRHTWMPHLPFSSKDDLNKKFWENIHFDIGWGYAMVWTGWSSIIPKHLFRQEAVILYILFFKSSLKKIAGVASVPQTAATTFDLHSVFIIILLYLLDHLGHFVPVWVAWRRPVLSAGMFCHSWSSLGLHSVEAPFIFRHCFSFNCFKMV